MTDGRLFAAVESAALLSRDAAGRKTKRDAEAVCHQRQFPDLKLRLRLRRRQRRWVSDGPWACERVCCVWHSELHTFRPVLPLKQLQIGVLQGPQQRHVPRRGIEE